VRLCIAARRGNKLGRGLTGTRCSHGPAGLCEFCPCMWTSRRPVSQAKTRAMALLRIYADPNGNNRFRVTEIALTLQDFAPPRRRYTPRIVSPRQSSWISCGLGCGIAPVFRSHTCRSVYFRTHAPQSKSVDPIRRLLRARRVTVLVQSIILKALVPNQVLNYPQHAREGIAPRIYGRKDRKLISDNRKLVCHSARVSRDCHTTFLRGR
jgi:hypothetical protein